MIFKVIRMRHRGVALLPKQLRNIDPIRGDVRITHESNILGRSSVVAIMGGDLPLDAPRLPDLLDCQLHSMANNAMVLSGIEEIDGVTYAQSWLCRYE